MRHESLRLLHIDNENKNLEAPSVYIFHIDLSSVDKKKEDFSSQAPGGLQG